MNNMDCNGKCNFKVEINIIEKLSKARQLKFKGNDYFKEKNYKKAIHQYHSGLMYLKGVECDIQPIMQLHSVEFKPINLSKEETEDIHILTGELQNNLAACLLKQDPVRYDRVLECCLKVTEKQPNNLKALYRMGLACYHLQDYSRAKETVKKADEIARGKDVAVRNLSILIESKLKEEEKGCMAMYKESLLKNLFN